jgi:hypothetical protein
VGVMEPIPNAAPALPPLWKFAALFTPPPGHDREWRAWLAEAQKAEEETTLRYWAKRMQRHEG